MGVSSQLHTTMFHLIKCCHQRLKKNKESRVLIFDVYEYVCLYAYQQVKIKVILKFYSFVTIIKILKISCKIMFSASYMSLIYRR